MQEIAFKAEDGFPLRGTLFSGPGQKPAVLISSAAAVPTVFIGILPTDCLSSALLTYSLTIIAE